MTETKKNNKQATSDNRISTHPSYTEYSWDNLVGGNTAAADAGVGTLNAPSANPTKGKLKTAYIPHRREDVKKRGADITAKPKEKGSVKAGAGTAVSADAKIKTKKRIRIHTITVEKKYAFPISVVLLALCFTTLIVAIVTTAVQINEITQINSDLESKYNSMISDENELRLLLETRDDLRVVERMAKEELGMVKIDQVERYYLTVHQEDKIEIIEETEKDKTGLLDGIADLGNSIVERIRDFFGM